MKKTLAVNTTLTLEILLILEHTFNINFNIDFNVILALMENNCKYHTCKNRTIGGVPYKD
jgi:hypothetical protein